MQSIIAAEIGYQDLAHEYFEHALFVDLDDLHNNASDGVHVASAGGVWTALVCGFGGMRDYDGELSFDPRLPVEWPELSFALQWHGSALQVTVTAGRVARRRPLRRPGRVLGSRPDVDRRRRGAGPGAARTSGSGDPRPPRVRIPLSPGGRHDPVADRADDLGDPDRRLHRGIGGVARVPGVGRGAGYSRDAVLISQSLPGASTASCPSS